MFALSSTISVGGGGSSTPDGYLSVLDFGAIADDPGDGSGTECAAAFQACFDACMAERKHAWVPCAGPATAPAVELCYKISTTVAVNPPGYGHVFRVDGGGTILCNTGLTAFTFQFANIEHITVDINLRGLITNLVAPTRVRFADCLEAIRFAGCREAFYIGSRIYWLGAEDSILTNYGGGQLWVRDCLFEGACGRVASVRSVNWEGINVENVFFVDIGLVGLSQGGDAIGTAPFTTIAETWIQIDNPIDSLRGTIQQVPTFRNILFDESCLRHIRIAPLTFRVGAVLIEECRGSAFRTNTTPPSFDIADVDVVHMYRSSSTRLSPGGGVADSDGVSLQRVNHAVLDGCHFGAVAGDSNIVRVDADCGIVELRNMVEGEDYVSVVAAAPVIAVPAIPLLFGASDGMSPWTITPGSGGGLVTHFALCSDGVPQPALFTATGASIVITQPALGPVWTVIAIGPSGASARSTPPVPPPSIDLTTDGTFSRPLEGSYLISAPTNGTPDFVEWAAADERRIEDRGDLALPGLLMEKAATNYMLESRAPQTYPAPWASPTGSVNGNNANGIDGTMVAAGMQIGATTVSSYQLTPGPAGQVCASMWVRGRVATESTQLLLGANNFASHFPVVLSTPAAAFQRLSASAVAVANSGMLPVDGTDETLNGGQGPTAQDVIVDGCQLEAGSYPTSVIRTAGATVTRPADTLSVASGDFPVELLTDGFLVQFAPDASSAEIVTDTEDWRLVQVGSDDYLRIRQSGADCVIDLVCGTVVVATLTVTFSRYQQLNITAKPLAGSVTVDGATTGDGTDTGVGAAWPAATTLYVGGDDTGANNATGRFIGSRITADV